MSCFYFEVLAILCLEHEPMRLLTENGCNKSPHHLEDFLNVHPDSKNHKLVVGMHIGLPLLLLTSAYSLNFLHTTLKRFFFNHIFHSSLWLPHYGVEFAIFLYRRCGYVVLLILRCRRKRDNNRVSSLAFSCFRQATPIGNSHRPLCT